MTSKPPLAGLRDRLPGTVKFLFQPAEEGAPGDEEGGARLMIEQGCMDDPKVGAVFGMLGLNQLPMHYHPLFRSKVFEQATDDAFFISIESWDPRFDPSATGKLLESLGARSVELLES